MNDRDAIEARIRAFIADYATWERDSTTDHLSDTHLPLPCDITNPFDFTGTPGEVAKVDEESDRRLRNGLEEVARRHCTAPDLLTRSGFSYGSPPMHDPGLETIVAVHIEGAGARVETVAPGGRFESFEYDLEKIHGDWRIAQVRFFIGTAAPDFPPDWTAAKFGSQFSVWDDAGIDFAAAFVAGAVAFNRDTNQVEPVTVIPLGCIPVPSRLLTVASLGDPTHEAQPMGVRLPHAELPLELARLGGCNAIVRGLLQPGITPVAYVPARFASVDEAAPPALSTRTGTVLIADADAWARTNPRDGQRFFMQLWEKPRALQNEEPASIMPLPGKSGLPGAAVVRGGGEVDCPCYWGIDEAGTPAVLIVDLHVAGKYVMEQFEIPASEQLLAAEDYHAPLEEFGVSIRFARDAHTLIVRSRGEFSPRVDLLDAAGRQLASTDNSGFHTSDETDRLTFLQPLPSDLRGKRLRVRWERWQHAFARP